MSDELDGPIHYELIKQKPTDPIEKLAATVTELGDTVFGLIALCISLEERIVKLEAKTRLTGIQLA